MKNKSYYSWRMLAKDDDGKTVSVYPDLMDELEVGALMFNTPADAVEFLKDAEMLDAAREIKCFLVHITEVVHLRSGTPYCY